MDSKSFSVQQIFQDRRQYRVPFYQRPYVWNREEQWEPLWDDIGEKANSRLMGSKAIPHFMGAVVLEPQTKRGLMGVERYHIIDGQQRLTTLQYVLTALVHALRSAEQGRLLPLIQACLANDNPQTMEDAAIECFKLWPTFRDRKQYELAMTAESIDYLRERFPSSFTQSGTLRKIGADHPPALEAILFFYDSMGKWLIQTPDGDLAGRAIALTSAVLTDLSIVCISLSEDDDAQVIFETLNGRGAELHATDLIRNFIFMQAGNDAAELYDNLWSQFESPLWGELQSRGRLNRPRLEWFVQTVVQAQTGDDIEIGRLYAGYRRFVDTAQELRSAKAQLQMLNQYAVPYRELITGLGNSPIAVFGRRLAVWDVSPTHALALRVAVSKLTSEEQTEVFECIESYLVRRAVCGLSRKNYNKVFVQQLKRLIENGLDPTSLRETLSSLTGDASRWPSDDEFRKELREGPLYPGRLDAPKLRSLFHRIETVMRSEKSEEKVPLDMDALDIDHILPQSWSTHWPLPDGTLIFVEDIETARQLRFLEEGMPTQDGIILRREDAIARLGNLTLVHYGLNRGLQNRGFEEKRRELFNHSNLQINRKLMQLIVWDEAAIVVRGEEIADLALGLWPGPKVKLRPVL